MGADCGARLLGSRRTRGSRQEPAIVRAFAARVERSEPSKGGRLRRFQIARAFEGGGRLSIEFGSKPEDMLFQLFRI